MPGSPATSPGHDGQEAGGSMPAIPKLKLKLADGTVRKLGEQEWVFKFHNVLWFNDSGPVHIQYLTTQCFLSLVITQKIIPGYDIYFPVAFYVLKQKIKFLKSLTGKFLNKIEKKQNICLPVHFWKKFRKGTPIIFWSRAF